MRVVDREVGGVHRCSEFVTVGAVADERADETRTMGWLRFGDDIRAQQMETIIDAKTYE